MPLSGVQGMSLGEYNAAGAATGLPGAANDLQSLGQTIAMGPYRQAQGAAMGAQTAHSQAVTREIRDKQVHGARAQELMADPSTWSPTQDGKPTPGLAELMSYAGRYPDESAHVMQNVVNNLALRAATSGGDMTQSSNLAAVTGQTPMGNTPTGFNADLANRLRQSTISAGPGYAQAAAARYGHELALKGHMATVGEQGREFDLGTHPAMGPGNLPGLFTQKDLSGGGYGPLSETALGANQTRQPVALPGGGTGFATPDTPGVRPIITSDQGLGMVLSGQALGQGQGGITSGGPVPLPGGGPDPTALPAPGAPPPSAAPSAGPASLAQPTRAGAPGSPGNIPSTGNPIADAMLRQKVGLASSVPAAKAIDPKELDAQITTALAKNLIKPDQKTGLFPVDAAHLQMDPQVRSMILARVNELTHGDDPLYKNQPDVAIERAIQDLQPSLTLDAAHTLNPLNRDAVAANPTVRWTPPQPVPSVANTIAPPARPTAGPARPGQPQEGQTATNPQTGQKIVFRGGAWAPM